MFFHPPFLILFIFLHCPCYILFVLFIFTNFYWISKFFLHIISFSLFHELLLQFQVYSYRAKYRNKNILLFSMTLYAYQMKTLTAQMRIITFYWALQSNRLFSILNNTKQKKIKIKNTFFKYFFWWTWHIYIWSKSTVSLSPSSSPLQGWIQIKTIICLLNHETSEGHASEEHDELLLLPILLYF